MGGLQAVNVKRTGRQIGTEVNCASVTGGQSHSQNKVKILANRPRLEDDT